MLEGSVRRAIEVRAATDQAVELVATIAANGTRTISGEPSGPGRVSHAGARTLLENLDR